MKYKNISLLLFIVLALNLIWEFSHYRLYIDLTGILSTIHLIGASFVDVALVFAVLFISSRISKSKDITKQNYFILFTTGLIFAFIWEFINLNLGRWQYTELMPTIFGVGLSPLLQLAVTGGISLVIFRKIAHRAFNYFLLY